MTRHADPVAQQEIDRLTAKLQEVLRLHQRVIDRQRPWCIRCDSHWPCRTTRVVMGEPE